jgi:hypothetical protein
VSNITLRRPALNIPLLALWAASIGVTVLGSTLLQRGNADLAAFYTAGGSDYSEFLGLQSQGTIGGMLLTAGVIGVFIALATHARNRAATLVAGNARTAATDEEDHLGDALYIEDVDDADDVDEPTDVATRPDAAVAVPTNDATVPVAEGQPAGAEAEADATADADPDAESERPEPVAARG